MTSAQTQAPSTASYKLEALCEMTGFTRRQVHQLSHKGALPPPLGHARHSYYTDHHVDALRRIRPWLLAGVSLPKIAEHIKAGASTLPDYASDPNALVTDLWSRVRIGQRVEIAVLMGGSDEQTNRDLQRHLVEQAKAFLAGKTKVTAPVKSGTLRGRPPKRARLQPDGGIGGDGAQ